MKEEALATIVLLEEEHTVISSRFALRMIEEISDYTKYEHAYSLITEYMKEIVKEEDIMQEQATDLQRICNLSKLEDALHIILAGHGKAEYFATVDQEILNKKSCIELQMQKLGFRLNIANPKDLVKR